MMNGDSILPEPTPFDDVAKSQLEGQGNVLISDYSLNAEAASTTQQRSKKDLLIWCVFYAVEIPWVLFLVWLVASHIR